jgi:hypothetical protein
MKHLVVGLTFSVFALAQHPKVSDCFKVHSMMRADEAHYWTTWTNACPYTIDSVYVLVRFTDQSQKDIADGVWSLHFIEPGAHRTMKFSAPGKLTDFASVRQHKITADMNEAFGKPAQTAATFSPMELAAVSAYKEAIVRDASPRPPHAATVGHIIGDPGEASFRTDFPDPWRAVLTPGEAAVSPAPRPAFVRFVSDEHPLYQ